MIKYFRKYDHGGTHANGRNRQSTESSVYVEYYYNYSVNVRSKMGADSISRYLLENYYANYSDRIKPVKNKTKLLSIASEKKRHKQDSIPF